MKNNDKDSQAVQAYKMGYRDGARNADRRTDLELDLQSYYDAGWEDSQNEESE